MKSFSISKLFTDRNFAVLTLVIMSVQFIAVEGMAVSAIKVGFMALMPIFFITKCPYVSKAFICSLFYLLVTILVCEINHGITRSSTFFYSGLFLITFIVYYNLVWIKQVFSLQFFLRVITGLIYAYGICIIIQQLCFLIGIRSFTLINLVGADYYQIFRLNSLAIEPSHAARILTVLFYAFLKCTQFESGYPITIKRLFKEYKYLVILFIYTMFSIGSGTGMVGLAIISIYFCKKQYVPLILIITGSLYLFSPEIDYEPYTRASDTFEAAMTGDTEEVIAADASASSRVNIIIDTFNHLDVSDSETWFGHGIDSEKKYNINSAIYDYGLISYITKLLLFFGCCFTSFFSLGTLMFILLFSMNIGNIAYGWAALMIFSTIKYFKINS